MDKKYCYLTAAVGLTDGSFEPDGYDSGNGGKIRVNGKPYDYVDPDASCDKLYDDLIDFYDMTDYEYAPYHHRLKKNRLGRLLCLEDEFGNRMSSDYIGPSRYWAHAKGNMNDAEIGAMLLHARTIGGHMLWPVHKIPTINTARGGQGGFFDRIDLTLQEIRYMMTDAPQSRNHAVRSAIEKEKAWFSLFMAGSGLDGFKSFVDLFHLNSFIYGDDYNVISLAESNLAEGVYAPISFDEPVFPADFRLYVKNNLIAIEKRA